MIDPPRETVLALDNIPLDLEPAGLGSRSVAALLDYLAVWLGVGLWVAILLGATSLAELGTGWMIGLGLAGLFALEWGWFLGWEVATGGRTPGKMALGLRVVDRRGGRAGTGALVARNLVRSVDLLVGGLLMALDPLPRRLGDWRGNTLVVHLPTAAREVALARIPAGWDARRVAVVEAFLAREGELEPARAEVLAGRIVGWLERDAPELLAAADGATAAGFRLRAALLAPGPPAGGA